MGARMKRICGYGLVIWGVATTVSASGPEYELELIDAVKQGDVVAVEALVTGAADVNRRQPDGATALHWAVYHDVLSTVDLLLAAGAEIDVANDYGVTPLALACENGSPAVVERLLAAGADPNRGRSTGETPLMTCARTGNLDAVQALLVHDADPLIAESWRHQTALMWAAGEGHADIVEALLAYGADSAARSVGGYSALLIAARHDNLALSEHLLRAGADVNGEAPDGMTPLLVATLRGHVTLAKLLLSHGADPNASTPGYSALHWAAGSWHTELTGQLRGIDTDREEEWRSLNGLRGGRVDLVKALLSVGANPNVRLVNHPPQFGFASGRFRVSVVGATPFLLAAMDGNVDVMRALVSAGADPLVGTDEFTSPLMVAAGLGQVPAETRVNSQESYDAVHYLLELGVDVNHVNEVGRSALHGAAHIRSDEIVQLLFDHGAQVNVEDQRGITPLMIAEGGGHILLPGLGGGSTADLLRALGSDEFAPESFIESYSQGAIR